MNHQAPPRLRRSESFLGIHFDFHAGKDCKEIGKRVTHKMIERIIDQVRPDYLQCDNKGHIGLSSYPTKVGNPAPGFVRDQLRIWREVTARRGVALYLHHSGVWDSEAIRRHPTWARVNADGKRDKNGTSFFGPYVDKLLIPQLKELCDEYAVDGVWIDGECWAAGVDYAPQVLAEFRKQTGIKRIPRKPTDPHFLEFINFCREGFRQYLRHYVDTLHAHQPGFQIASNWAFSSFMPEPVSADVDFLSGDYTNGDSVNSARLEGRALQQQGKPWDLMAWSFAAGRSTKSIPQLQREAAVVLALGGGFQAYFAQHRDASIMEWQMTLMAKVAEFCRARQKFCHRAQPVPQIGLVLSTEGYYRAAPNLLNPWAQQLVPLQGTLQCLLESQHSVEILMTHHLLKRAAEYPLLILPEWANIEPELRKSLLEYANNGGSLLIIGPVAAAHFKKELRVQLTGKPEERSRWLAHDGWLGLLQSVTQEVKLLNGATAFGKLHENDDFITPYTIAASIAPYGKGQIAASYINLGERYRKAATPTARRFLDGLVRKLFPRPLVEVRGSQWVDVTVNRLNDRQLINLVNTAGPHADAQVLVHDDIPPVGPLQITIRTPQKPRRILLQPEAKSLPFQYRNGEATLTLSSLGIHQIIEVHKDKAHAT